MLDILFIYLFILGLQFFLMISKYSVFFFYSTFIKACNDILHQTYWRKHITDLTLYRVKH